MHGQFLIEKLKTLPDFTTYDEGRFVYVYDEDRYYIGGTTQWINIIRGSNKFDSRDLIFGTELHQINAKSIPVVNQPSDHFTSTSSIQEVLFNLSIGQDLHNDSIKSRHISSRQILSTHLNTGFLENQINASNIPVKDTRFTEYSPPETDLQDLLTKLFKSSPIIKRQKIALSGWMNNPGQHDFVCEVSYRPITETNLVVQCWDDSNKIFLPSAIKVDNKNFAVKIYSPYPMDITVVIIG